MTTRSNAELPLPSGTVVSHYRILSMLGSGGMGEVYLAHDERLGRKVALKILPSEFVTDRLRLERFEREARTTSALNHPNILTVYDLGEEKGRYFIASEFIEGETLRHRLTHGKAKLREVIEISIQVAGALAAAHAEAVVHRDIKPENIMIRRDGYVKVLDFGLAKLLEGPAGSDRAQQSVAATARRVTHPGVVMGTVQYMSPEQAQGLAVDGRSDIFSFGVVLYEMISGHVPFEGPSTSHIIVSILEKQPAPLHRHAPDAPSELQRMVSKCLSKDPDERYQVAKDLLIDLKSLRHELEVSAEIETRSDEEVIKPMVARTTSSAEYLVGEIKRHKKGALIAAAVVAVIAIAALFLPVLTREAESGQRVPIAVADFTNQTGQPEFDGLSGMLITSLEQSRRLAVMTRSRMFDTLKRQGKDKVERIDEALGREICRAENVNALVTASISKFGDLYILDLKVLDPEKNEYLFTAKEQGKGAESIPGLIDTLSEKTRLALKEKSHEVRSSTAKIANVTTANLDAYQHYFRGQQLIAQLQFEKAEEEFKKATELDPTFALAHYGRAYALNWLGSRRAREHILLAMQYIDKAPEKERSLIRVGKATIDHDWDQAIATLKQLVHRYPNEKQVVYEVGDLSFHRRDYVAAENHLRKVLEMDPNFEPALQHLIWTYRDSGRHVEMLQLAQRYMERIPSEEAFLSLSFAHALSGDLDKALEVSRRAVDRFGATATSVSQLVNTHAHRSEYDAAAEAARTLLGRERSAADRQTGYQLLAALHSYRGEYRAAFSMFDQAVDIASVAGDLTGKTTSLSLEARAIAWSRLDDRKARRLASEALALEDSINTFGLVHLFDAYSVLRDIDPARQIAKEYFWGSQTPLHLLDGLDKLNKGDATGAVREIETMVRSESVLFGGRYYLAQAQLEAGQYEGAIDSAQRAQRSCSWFTHVSDIAARHEHIYPRTFYLLGKIYERKGDRQAARENYRKFLDLWKTADRDLPELIDARNRL